MRNPRGRHRRPPYFKVQFFDRTSLSWQDDRRAFETIDEANKYIARKHPTPETRIVIVEKNGREVAAATRP